MVVGIPNANEFEATGARTSKFTQALILAAGRAVGKRLASGVAIPFWKAGLAAAFAADL
jgi:hypothetical protein